MESLLLDHAALVLKHARRHVRATGIAVPAEDVAREAQLLVVQLGKAQGFDPNTIVSTDAFLRTLVGHAAGRVKRRRTLIEQVAAGDDLDAVSADLRAVDSDLPALLAAPTELQKDAARRLDRLKRAVAPADALVLALWLEDDLPLDEVATVLSRTEDEMQASRERILFTAKEQGIEGDPDRRAAPGTTGDADRMRERKVKDLASSAAPVPPNEPHVDAALTRLLGDGDASEDLGDAMLHVALCPDCRATLTEGEVRHHSVAVLAIEAPQRARDGITRAAEDSKVRLLERGQGRWAAVADPQAIASFQARLDTDGGGLVDCLSATAPVDVAVRAPGGRAPVSSVADVGLLAAGTSAAEVDAWAQVAQTARRRSSAGPHPGWLAFAILVIAGAAGVAYWLATR